MRGEAPVPAPATGALPLIGRLAGMLAEKNPPQVLLDCHGVGYLVDVPMSTFYQLPAVGQEAVLLTHLVVREDAQVLFGFASAAERDTFRLLIRISGVGPRTALAVLSGMSVAELTHAVAAQQAGRLVKVPGIGRKTAERLLLELKGKLADSVAPVDAAAGGAHAHDILQALLALGYNEKEAGVALRALPAGLDVADGIRQALRQLAG